MSNYPAGADCSNAPWNKEEMQGESVPLFDYIINSVEMSKEANLLLQDFDKKRIIAVKQLKILASEIETIQETIQLLESVRSLTRYGAQKITLAIKNLRNLIDAKKELFGIINLLAEPEIFLEDE